MPGHFKSNSAGAELVWCGCRLGFTGWSAHWRSLLSNTIELSVCGPDAAWCQITLTSCYCSCTLIGKKT